MKWQYCCCASAGSLRVSWQAALSCSNLRLYCHLREKERLTAGRCHIPSHYDSKSPCNASRFTFLSFRSQETYWENKGVQPQDCSLQWERDLWSLQWRKGVHFREATREDWWYRHGTIFSLILNREPDNIFPFSFQPQPFKYCCVSDNDSSL